MKQRSTARWIWDVTGRKKGYILALTLIQALAGTTDVIYALLFRAVVDSAVAKDAEGFVRHVLLIAALVLLQLSLSAVIRWLYELAKSEMENTFKRRLVDSILHKDYASVSAVHTAEWLNRLTSDTVVVAGGAVELVPDLVETTVRLASALVMIIVLDRWFACVLIPGGIVMVALGYAFRKILKRLHRNIQESDGRLRIFLQERISSLMVIKAFAAEKQTAEGAGRAMDEHKAARLRRNRFSNLVSLCFGAGMDGMYLLCIVYCAHGIMSARISYGTLTAVMQLIGQVQGPFTRFSGYLPRWYGVTASAERLMEAEAFPEDGPEDGAHGATQARAFYRERFRALALRGARFTYPAPARAKAGNEAAQEPLPVVLRDVSLEIRKGEYVAFTGHSGCGKTTVLKLLMCMYPLDAGSRLLIGQDGEIPLTASWRGLFAYVPQGNQLMNGKVRDVVAFGCPERAGDDEGLLQALSVACADEFLPELENGLDTPLGERGSGLSEGQTQRLAIARAVFSGSPILLLDEATSALDESTEKRLIANLRGLTDRTAVIVTHRPAALGICDRVFVFTEDGVEEV